MGVVAVVLSVLRVVAVPFVLWVIIRKLFRFGETRRQYAFLQNKRGRKLGATESLLDYGQEVYGFMINVNCILIGCTEEISVNHVRRVVRKLCLRHPVLRCRTQKGLSGKMTERFLVEDNEFEPDLKMVEDSDWKQYFHEQLKTKFKENDGLWRVLMFNPVRDDDIDGPTFVYPFIFSFNHCCIDGASIMAGVNQDFLTFLEQELNNDAVTVDMVESLPLLDTRENIFSDLKIGFVEYVHLFYETLFGKSGLTETDPHVDVLRDVRRPTSVDKETKLLTFALDENESHKIICKCKELNVKVNGFMTAAVAMATRELLQDHHLIDHNATSDFRSAFMVNLRRFARPPISDNVIGKLNSMTSMEITVPPLQSRSPKIFRTLAEEYHNIVHSKINNKEHFADSKKLDFAAANFGEKLTQVLLGMEGKSHIFYITNRGAFHISSNAHKPRCTFEGTYWATAEHMVGLSLFTHSLCSVNGRVFWSMAYSAHMVHQTIAEEYIAKVKDIIFEMSSD